jgi:uncharacterized protein YjiS (DUF1127 family)
MALYDTSATGAFGAATRFSSFLSELAARFDAWQRARATARVLRHLSPSQLADIGIEAGDIDGFAERLASRRRF